MHNVSLTSDDVSQFLDKAVIPASSPFPPAEKANDAVARPLEDESDPERTRTKALFSRKAY